LTVELLESRDLLSGLTLTPLVQVSGPDPFAGTTADLSQQAPLLFNREAENSAAVNPTNPKNMIDVWRQDQGNFSAGASSLGIAGATTFDGGVTWKELVIPGVSLVSGGHFQCATDPSVSFGPTGIAYVSCLAFDLSGPGFAGDIDVNISRDGGLSWSAPITVRHDTDPSFYNDKDWITADPHNPSLVYAVWDRGNFADGSAHRSTSAYNGYTQPGLFARSLDAGQTWQPTQIIYDPGANNDSFDHQVVVRPDGTLFDFFAEVLHNDSLGDVRATHLSCVESLDHGQTWLPNGHANRAAESMGLATIDPNTGQWVEQGLGRFLFNVAVDPHNGNLYTVWSDGRFSGGQNNSIAFIMSADGGSTWSAPVKINQTPTTIAAADQQAFEPTIAVAADGSVAVAYYDFRNDVPGGRTLTDYWLVHADAGVDLTNPANWSELRLTNRSFDLQKATLASQGANGEFLGDYQSLVASGNSFGAFFSMTTKDAGPHLFFRDPPSVLPGPLAAAPFPQGNSGFIGSSATQGGGIYFVKAPGLLEVQGSTFSLNTASDSGGGLYNLGTATLQECTLSGNTAGSAGGGVFNGASGTLTVKDSTMLDNVAPFGADLDNLGAVTLDDSTVGVSGP
jgi:hypothetical protein